jgi:hypothetical protein
LSASSLLPDSATEQRIRALSVTQVEELVLTAPDLQTNKDLIAWLRAHSKAERE